MDARGAIEERIGEPRVRDKDPVVGGGDGERIDMRWGERLRKGAISACWSM
eukprot:GAFH01003431.1.p4 GENE.GAFH01003431.1~~GAFH01003431.1.p4  ORF type:complete len:51 (+),score=2.24 GAFH01003431.1:340-492(+)